MTKKTKIWVCQLSCFILLPVRFYGGLNKDENSSSINGKSRWTARLAAWQYKPYTNPYNFADVS